MDLDIRMYGTELTKVKYLKILGMTIEGLRLDPFRRMELLAKRRFKLITRQLKTHIKDGGYKISKTLYHTILLSRTLYGSESWNSTTIYVHPNGKIMESYDKDFYGTTSTELPDYARTANTCYKAWFGTRHVMKDIKLLKNKGEIQTYEDIPLLPTQIMVQKDLAMLFDICDPRTTMDLDDFLEPSGNGSGRTRSSKYSAIERAVNNKSQHHQTRSIFRRHRHLLIWMDGLWDFAEIAGMKKDPRRRKLQEILSKLAVSYTHLTLPTICSV